MKRAAHFALAYLITASTSTAVLGNPSFQAGPTANTTTTEQGQEPGQAATAEVPASHSAETIESHATLEETFRLADEQFQAAHYARAAELFTRVWHLAQTSDNRDRWGRYIAIFAFNAATSHRLARDCDAAFMAFSHYVAAFNQLSTAEQAELRQATDLPAENESWLTELKQECPNERKNAISAAPHADNPAPAERSEIQLQPSGNWLLDVNLPQKSKTRVPEDGASTSNPNLGWLLTAGGAASLAVSGYFLWSGIQNNQDAIDPANKHERYTDYAALRDRDYAAASIIGALGIGLTSVGVYIVAASSDSSDTSRATSNPRVWLFARGTHLGIGAQL
jgi:hypothetical protein